MKTTTAKTSPLFAALAKIAPSFAFSVQWERDHHFRWDGQGENPKVKGLYPHDVSIRCSVIGYGELRHGFANMGGCYSKPGCPDPDINGYLPQMLVEAIDGLPVPEDVALPEGAEAMAHYSRLEMEAGEMVDYLKGEMLRRYEQQRRANFKPVAP